MSSLAKEIAVAAVQPGVDAAKHSPPRFGLVLAREINGWTEHIMKDFCND